MPYTWRMEVDVCVYCSRNILYSKNHSCTPARSTWVPTCIRSLDPNTWSTSAPVGVFPPAVLVGSSAIVCYDKGFHSLCIQQCRRDCKHYWRWKYFSRDERYYGYQPASSGGTWHSDKPLYMEARDIVQNDPRAIDWCGDTIMWLLPINITHVNNCFSGIDPKNSLSRYMLKHYRKNDEWPCIFTCIEISCPDKPCSGSSDFHRDRHHRRHKCWGREALA